MIFRRTKIVATLGPATDEPGVLDGLVAAGMDCARLNCSHGGPDELRRRAGELRAAAARAGRPLALLLDLQGPKLRLARDTAERALVAGDELVLVGSELPGDGGRVCVDMPDFAGLVSERSEIVIGDGVPRLVCTRVAEGAVRARVVAAGRLAPRKGVNVTFARPALPAITDKDLGDIALAAELDADWVALSFVRGADDVRALRRRLSDAGARARTIAKVEKVEAYEQLDEVVAAADGVMVARGDLGVEAGLARVPLMQKDTIHRATRAGRLVITATQMLESMIEAPEPTRAEVADVANAVIDGTSAVMLSAETSIGAHPVAAVRVMSQIALAAQEGTTIRGAPEEDPPAAPAAAVMHAAVGLADEVDATAIVVPTSTGRSARACAKYRRPRTIIALTPDPQAANELALEWGIEPATLPDPDSVDVLLDAALVRARDVAGLEHNARVVITAGPRAGTPGATNLVVLREIP